MIKDHLQKIITACAKSVFGVDVNDAGLAVPPKKEMGDYACQLSLKLAKSLGQNPRQVAEKLSQALMQNSDGLIAQTEIAGPGFINIRLTDKSRSLILSDILSRTVDYGKSARFSGKKALVEFVSANPTGPLHIGHGRGAVVGDTLARLLRASGYTVEREYYVNDGGVQMMTLGKSLWLRHQQAQGLGISFPEDCYQGDYIKDLAASPPSLEIIARELTPQKIHQQGEEPGIRALGEYAGNAILDQIMQDLKSTEVNFENVFYESSLFRDKSVDATLDELRLKGMIYEKDGAVWLKSTAHGDDKDRVIVKSGGATTYLAPDISYHRNKYQRGFDLLVNVWGADHAGYIPRLKAALKGLGQNTDALHVNFIQMVNLIRDGELVSMSTRRASYITLEEVRDQVGCDVVRYFFLMRSHNAQLDFDLNLATKQSQDNPVYYVQYAHARICAIFRKAKEEGVKPPEKYEEAMGGLITKPEELHLVGLLSQYPEAVLQATESLEPHKITYYVQELAQAFQHYYSRAREDASYRIIGDDAALTQARLSLLLAVRQVFINAFGILGITAPEQM